MCLICVDFQKDRLTLAEAKRAFGEMAENLDPEHVEEVRTMLERAEEAEASEKD